ncbi:MAG: hypothetical protein ACYS26_17165 [Planctomycetota bacterium]
MNDGHDGEVYEVTGPQLMTFAEIARDLSEATGREIPFVSLSVEQFRQGLIEAGLPQDYRELLEFLFTTVLDGRNESLTDGVQRALGRQPKPFSAFAQSAAATGIWNEQPQQA